VVVEAATRESLAQAISLRLREGQDIFVIGVGGLLDHPEWFREAEGRGCRILLLSGPLRGWMGFGGGGRPS
jgi:predicted dinucleotide-utilizing enzyme